MGKGTEGRVKDYILGAKGQCDVFGSRITGENVGSYTIDASALANGNYVVTAHNGALSIDARPITVTADAKSKVYGNVDPGLTYQVTQGSLVEGH